MTENSKNNHQPYNEHATTVRDVLEMAIKNSETGSARYTAYMVDGPGHDSFGYLVTPDDNVLCVNQGDFGGIRFTLKYVPSKSNGSGCSCMDKEFYSVDMDTIKEAEKEGLKFADKLHAKLYKDSGEWKAYEQKFWNLVEINAESKEDIDIDR